MKKIILITGAGKGLGRVIAQILCDRGFTVYGTYLTSNQSLLKGINYYKMDITSDDDCSRVVSDILKKEKKVDVLINCAGISISGPTLKYTTADFHKILDTNVVGAFRMIKALSNSQLKLVVNITSLNGFLSLPNFGLYAASKFAFEALGTALRYELYPSIKVVNVAPGALASVDSSTKMVHKPVREKFPIIGFLLPLTKMDSVAEIIVKIINSTNVPARVNIGRDAKIVSLMQKFIPVAILDRIFLFLWRKK